MTLRYSRLAPNVHVEAISTLLGGGERENGHKNGHTAPLEPVSGGVG